MGTICTHPLITKYISLSELKYRTFWHYNRGYVVELKLTLLLEKEPESEPELEQFYCKIGRIIEFLRTENIKYKGYEKTTKGKTPCQNTNQER